MVGVPTQRKKTKIISCLLASDIDIFINSTGLYTTPYYILYMPPPLTRAGLFCVLTTSANTDK